MKTNHIDMQKKMFNLFEAMACMQNKQEVEAFLTDLCTPTELEAMADRWVIIPLLKQKVPYREIHAKTGVSVATITRVARCLTTGEGGYDLIYNRISEK